jgi:hypothetical protein
MRTTSISERTEETVAAQASAGNLVQAKRSNTHLHVILILLAGVLARIPFYLAFRPIWSGDSPGYAAPYAMWTYHVFGNGERTPVYPLFLGLVQWLAMVTPKAELDIRAAYIAILTQSILNIIGAVLFYFSLRSLRIRATIAFGSSLFLATISGVCSFEMNILNMSLSFFLLVLAAFLFLRAMNGFKEGRGNTLLATATGFALALAVLNRPDMLIFVVLLLTITACMRPKSQSTSDLQSAARPLKAATWIGIPVAFAVIVWMCLMYVAIGEFRITTLDGWNRSRTVYNMFDSVDEEDRAIGVIMSRTYRQQVDTGADVNIREIMWQAQNDLYSNYARYPIVDPNNYHSPLGQKAIRITHDILGLVEVRCEGGILNNYCWEGIRVKINTGDYLGRVSSKLARRYPKDWVANIVGNFVQESFNFSYMEPKSAVAGFKSISPDGREAAMNEGAARLTIATNKVHAPLLLLTYLITLCYFALSPLVLFRKQDEHWLHDAVVTSLAIASVGTIIGTCVLAGYNRAYSLPHLVIFVICTAYAWANRSRIVAAVSARLHWTLSV